MSKSDRFANRVIEEVYPDENENSYVQPRVRIRDIKAWLRMGYEAGRRETLMEITPRNPI